MTVEITDSYLWAQTLYIYVFRELGEEMKRNHQNRKAFVLEVEEKSLRIDQ